MKTTYSLIFIALSVLLCTGLSNVSRADSWLVTAAGTTSSKLTAVAIGTQQFIYVVGANGTLLRSTDGGATFAQQKFIVGYQGKIYAIAAIDTDYVMSAGEVGELVYNANSQKLWASSSQMTTAFFGIGRDLTADPTFYAVGEGGTILQTVFTTTLDSVDINNVSWYSAKPGYSFLNSRVTMNLYGAACTTDNAYVVGDSGAVLRSRDHGVSWTSTFLGADVALRSVATLSTTKAVAVGLKGNVWMTTNGGTSWTRVQVPGLTSNLNGVSFSDALIGVAVGDDGMIIKSTNGGVTWTRQAVNTFANLNAVHCYLGPDGGNWVAAGDSGTIATCQYGGSNVEFTKDKSSIDFGDVQLLKKQSSNVLFNNTSTLGYLAVQLINGGAALTLSPTRQIIEPLGSGTFKATFAPTDTGAVSYAVLVRNNASLFPDTLRVTGRGIAAISQPGLDSVVFDTARVGTMGELTVHNGGNIPLTASIAFVSDSNFSVTTDASAAPNADLHISVRLKHLLTTDHFGFFVLQTNDYRAKRDTFQLVARGVDTTSSFVGEGTAPSDVAMFCYPNVLASSETGTLRIMASSPSNLGFRLFNALGEVEQSVSLHVDGVVTLPLRTTGLAGGVHFYELTRSGGQSVAFGSMRIQ